MVISKELLKERLALLQNERSQAQAQVSGYEGAIQDTEHWLEELEKEEPKSDAKVAPKPRLEEVKK